MNDALPIVIGPDSEAPLSQIGGKALALARLRQADLPIPVWFTVTPAAFVKSAGAASADIDWSRLQLAPEVESAIAQALAEYGLADQPLAVRSSSVEEDGASSSFAGQFESFLCVSRSELPRRIIDVWKSGYADRVASYKAARGESGAGNELPSVPAVIVQRMVNARCAGVAFSANPVSARWSHCLVSSVFGLGSSLVDGASDSDNYIVGRDGEVVESTVANKSLARRISPAPSFQLEEKPLPAEQATAPSLTPEQAKRVAALARQCAVQFGRPQDIEWAIQDEQLFLLQSRPITTLHRAADPDARRFIWDNSNIAESYEGVTTPLTFSFARYIYTEVYRQFCLILKVSPRKVEDQRALFGQMLGLIEGRVYYNLLSWYRVLALLPGFALNRGFMEQMMGVKESLPPEVLSELAPARFGGKLLDGFNLARSIGSLIVRHIRIRRDIDAFNKRLADALQQTGQSLESKRLDELAEAFHVLESRLLTRWDAPLVNDFIAMIFFGSLKSTCERWIGAQDESLHNELLCDMGDIISAQPARRIQELATIAQASPDLVAALRSSPLRDIRKAVEQAPDFKAKLDEYFAIFGDRCLSELKLESLALIDDPMQLFRSIGELAATQSNHPNPAQSAKRDNRQEQAEQRAFAALSGKPLKRLLFRWILKHARRRVRGRENLRFERTRLFGRIRRIFLEIGKRLAALNAIDDARDVFYLEIYEIIGYIEGSASFWDLKGHIALRKTEYARYRETTPPDDRFETRGPVPIGNAFRAERKPESDPNTGTGLRGIGCCPGIVRGKVRVAHDPQSTRVKQGEILVALQTDPGWIMLFPLASGLLVERGSLLSHSAIVSRELGLPAIVSIKGLMTTLKTGDEVEMDGSTGRIAILNQTNDTR